MNTYNDTFTLINTESSLAEKCAKLRVEMIKLASPEPEEINEASLFEYFVSTFRTCDVTYLRTLLATLTEAYNEMVEKHSQTQTQKTKVKHMKSNKKESKSKQEITYPIASLITFAALIIYTVIAFIIDANI